MLGHPSVRPDPLGRLAVASNHHAEPATPLPAGSRHLVELGAARLICVKSN